MAAIKKNRGQATLEFILAFGIGFIFVAGIIKISLGMTTGYLAHYASFVAARHYLVFDSNGNNEGGIDQSAANSTRVYYNESSMKGLLPESTEMEVFAPGTIDGFNLQVGVRINFKQNFFSASLFGGREATALTTEAFLGRSPSQYGCFRSICQMFTEIGGSCTGHVTLYDDGC